MADWNKCPKCGNTIQSNDEFCPKCGEELTIKCSKCGAHWRFYYEYKFCRTCGSSVKKK